MTLNQLIAEKWHWLSDGDKTRFQIATTIGCTTCGRRFLGGNEQVVREPLCPCSYMGGHMTLECQACVKTAVEAARDTPLGRAMAKMFEQIKER